MHTLLQDLAVVMIVAGLVTIISHRFKQPVVLGYIPSRRQIIGPHTPPYQLIHVKETINTLAELGIILLMFSLDWSSACASSGRSAARRSSRRSWKSC